MSIKSIFKLIIKYLIEILGIISSILTIITSIFFNKSEPELLHIILLIIFSLSTFILFFICMYKSKLDKNRISAFQNLAYNKKLHSLGLILINNLLIENNKYNNPLNEELSVNKTIRIKKAEFKYFIDGYSENKSFCNLTCEYIFTLKRYFQKKLNFNFLVLRDTGSKINYADIELINYDNEKELYKDIRPFSILPRNNNFERNDDIDFYEIKDKTKSLKNIKQIIVRFSINDCFDLHNTETLVVYPHNYAKSIKDIYINIYFQKELNNIIDCVLLKSINLYAKEKGQINLQMRQMGNDDKYILYTLDREINNKESNSIFFIDISKKKCPEEKQQTISKTFCNSYHKCSSNCIYYNTYHQKKLVLNTTTQK